MAVTEAIKHHSAQRTPASQMRGFSLAADNGGRFKENFEAKN